MSITNASGLAAQPVLRARRGWRRGGVVVACGVSLAALLAFVGWRWGAPLLASGVMSAVPYALDRRIGDAALQSFDASLLRPSQLPAARQDEIRRAFDHVVDRYPEDRGVRYRVLFRSSVAVSPDRTQLGADAFALPGGAIVVTDEMVRLLQGRDDVLAAVLGHELGHVRHRHGMKTVARAGGLGGALALAWGHDDGARAAAPTVLTQVGYSRRFEREADDESIAILHANGIPPEAMGELFRRLATRRGDDATDPALAIGLANHPPDAERMARFGDASAH